jgi:hypothetical protein
MFNIVLLCMAITSTASHPLSVSTDMSNNSSITTQPPSNSTTTSTGPYDWLPDASGK